MCKNNDKTMLEASTTTTTATTTTTMTTEIWYPRRLLESFTASLQTLGLGRNKTRTFTRPKRIILVRHGEAECNVDKTVFSITPNPKTELTGKGRQQAYATGVTLTNMMAGESTMVYYSEFERAKETCRVIRRSWKAAPLNARVRVDFSRQDPRLIEQQCGSFQDHEDMGRIWKERNVNGHFFYQFPNGESGQAVYDRVSGFIGSLNREFKRRMEVWSQNPANKDQPDCMKDCNVVLVTHGLTIRYF